MNNKGYIHIYTGNGKGKTTAAFGLVIRALCARKRVFVGQFVKSMKYNETKIEDIFEDIQIEQFGQGCFIQTTPTEEDIRLAKAGLKRCEDMLNSDLYDLVVLDELSIALFYNLFTVEDVLAILKHKNPSVEVVITGRYAPQELIDIADLVTDMQEVKHYYTQGVLSRNGIDK